MSTIKKKPVKKASRKPLKKASHKRPSVNRKSSRKVKKKYKFHMKVLNDSDLSKYTGYGTYTYQDMEHILTQDMEYIQETGKNGKRVGDGTYIFENKTKFVGSWENDIPKSGKLYNTKNEYISFINNPVRFGNLQWDFAYYV